MPFENSDGRVKQNISKINKLKAINTIKQLEVCTYNFVDNKNQQRIGLIAQNVEKIAPIFVNTNPNSYYNINNFKSVNYTELHNLLIPATQELIKKVESQDKIIKKMIKKINDQEKQINFLQTHQF